MKTTTIYLLILLLLSSCATTRRCQQEPVYDLSGNSHDLKNLTIEQIKQLAEETGESFDRLMKHRESGHEFVRVYIRNSDTVGYNVMLNKDPNWEPDPLNFLFFEKYFIVNITPNPTYSSVEVSIENYYSTKNKDNEYLTDARQSCQFQLVFNERIIHQWEKDFPRGTPIRFTIPQEQISEAGTYALVCNMVGPANHPRSVSGTFMVMK